MGWQQEKRALQETVVALRELLCRMAQRDTQVNGFSISPSLFTAFNKRFRLNNVSNNGDEFFPPNNSSVWGCFPREQFNAEKIIITRDK